MNPPIILKSSINPYQIKLQKLKGGVVKDFKLIKSKKILNDLGVYERQFTYKIIFVDPYKFKLTNLYKNIKNYKDLIVCENNFTKFQYFKGTYFGIK